MSTLGKKDGLKIISFIFLLILIIITSLSAIANFIDIKIDFLQINPSDKLHQKVMHLEYPPSTVSGSIIINYSNNNTNSGLPLVSVDVAIQYNGTLTEQTPVNLGANGYVYKDGINKIVGLDASDYGFKYDYTLLLGLEGVELYDSTENFFKLPYGQIYLNLINDQNATKIHYGEPIQPMEVLQTIKWDTQGDYSPFIQILFSNGTSVTYSYPQYKIHVNNPEVVKQEHYSRVEMWLSISLFFFALIESPKILKPLLPEKIKTKLCFNQNPKTSNSTENCNRNTQRKPKQKSKNQKKI